MFSFSGRIGRRQYIVLTALRCLIALIAIVIGLAAVGDSSSQLPTWYREEVNSGYNTADYIDLFFTSSAFFLSELIQFSALVRRLHDLNSSGWFSLLKILPTGPLFEIALLFPAGTPGDNQYGADPIQEAHVKAARRLPDGDLLGTRG